MPFNLQHWQTQARAWWAERAPSLKATPIQSAYALLAASAWLPFLAAYADDPGPATTALRDLELIRAAGIEGLELAFELLESALREVQHDDQKEL